MRPTSRGSSTSWATERWGFSTEAGRNGFRRTIHHSGVSRPGWQEVCRKVIHEAVADKKWVQGRLSEKRTVIVDARPPKQYSGEEGEEIRRGHIPGARNLFWETTLEGNDVRTWKKKGDVERLFGESGIGRDKEIVVHCRTGREASHVYFTLKFVLGFPHVRLYRGSWVEWSADRKLPVKTGPEP